MDEFEHRYFSARMERETAIAQGATCPFVASIHAELARLYAERLGMTGAVEHQPVATAVNS